MFIKVKPDRKLMYNNKTNFENLVCHTLTIRNWKRGSLKYNRHPINNY